MLWLFFLLLVLVAVYFAILCKNDWTKMYLPAKILAFIGALFLLLGTFFLGMNLISLRDTLLLKKINLISMIVGMILLFISLIIDVFGNTQDSSGGTQGAVDRVRKRSLLISGISTLGAILFVFVIEVLFFY